MNQLQKKLHTIIFEADTKGGKAFDIVLLIAIVFSIVAVMLESVAEIKSEYGEALSVIEWFLTIIFSIEYLLRVIIVRRTFRYIFSFYGLVDLLSVLPSYLSLIIVGAPSLIVVRGLRLLRVFRILKLIQFSGEARHMINALYGSFRKIAVFLFAVLMITVIMGSLMYQIEGPENGFTSIPRSMYWAIVTMTTVGYGDIAPLTVAGQTMASILMVLGYGIIAVPTGIVGKEFWDQQKKITSNTQVCNNCNFDQHDDDASFCKMCGNKLH